MPTFTTIRSCLFSFLFCGFITSGIACASDLPPVDAFLMDEDKEIALAKSAAPEKISSAATIMVLRRGGYETVSKGTNGYVCLVVRSWGNPTHSPEYMYMPEIIVPECLGPNAVDKVLPVQLLRAELGAKEMSGEDIREAVLARFADGRFKRVETVAFSYMLSNGMTMGGGTKLPPHVMVYLPDHVTNDMAGGLSFRDRVMIVEGGPDEPFVAANIYRDGIDPIYAVEGTEDE